ncbi:agmatinase family protein [Pseudohongiella sp. SYSU M77423]|uniref:agmatinase family protein n=1 Tax=Pseudohongiella sp. SYSU M77423 TaxID=3042312 RepID=UPI00247FB764|nr:agmatinase family protein [Pseudohongiella sp. SYSU M77423]MDH7942353.1 agmatinase family protein [Pseudohongiella sp. SYSU M77423]
MTTKNNQTNIGRHMRLLLQATLSSALLLGQFATAQTEEESDHPELVEFPASLDSRLGLLSDEELEFLRTPRNTRSYAEDLDQLVEQIEKRSADEVKAYVEAMMWVRDQRGFQEGQDLDHIPLNTDTPEFNAWKVRRPRSFDPEREPGPISLGRYMRGNGGIPTFAGAPVALTPEDLIAGEVDVAFVGAPLNMGSGWRGAQHGPLALRTMGRMSGNDQYTQVNAGSVLNIVDYGDIAIDNDSTERSMEHVREVVREIVETGAIPFIIGGDHSLEYPNVAALVDVFGVGNLGVIHFDAHYDVGRDRAHLIDHGAPIYRLLNEGLITGADYIQVGLRANSPNESIFRWMREEGFKYHTMAEVEKYGWDYVLERVLAEAKGDGRKLYISFDVDVLDPSYTSATGTPVSGGITPREAIPIVRRLCAESNVVGFDLVEVAPELDPTYVTTLHSAAIAKACLTGVAMRRLELTEPHYLNPVSLDHAQDDYHEENQQ